MITRGWCDDDDDDDDENEDEDEVEEETKNAGALRRHPSRARIVVAKNPKITLLAEILFDASKREMYSEMYKTN